MDVRGPLGTSRHLSWTLSQQMSAGVASTPDTPGYPAHVVKNSTSPAHATSVGGRWGWSLPQTRCKGDRPKKGCGLRKTRLQCVCSGLCCVRCSGRLEGKSLLTAEGGI